MLLSYSKIIYPFDKNAPSNDWQIVDDRVMGGVSRGQFKINEDGHGEFSGKVSLDNNGGFSSVRHTFDKTETKNYTYIKIKLKGDKKNYQIRLKKSNRDYFSYINTFETNGNWEEIKIPLKDFYPSFRGRTLNLPNYNHEGIEEIAFLIANSKNETFKLLLSEISLE